MESKYNMKLNTMKTKILVSSKEKKHKNKHKSKHNVTKLKYKVKGISIVERVDFRR